MKIENCKLKIAKRKGFTLIEVLVVIAIIGILAAITLVSLGKNLERDARFEKDRFTTFIRDAQNRSLTAETAGASVSAGKKICGFGIHFDESDNTRAVMYFVQTGGASPLDVNCASKTDVPKDYDSLPDPKSDSELAVFYLGHQMQFDDGPAVPDVFFLVPHGDVLENEGDPASSSITVSITDNDETVSVPTDIFPSGLIQ